MRAAAIFGLGCSPKNLKPFQQDAGGSGIEWRIGLPGSADQADVILLFGGDGTVHRHLGQLIRLGLPVLVVPVGSGNDFAAALGFRRLSDSLAAWRSFCFGRDNLHAVDVGLITAVESPTEPSTNESSRESLPRSPQYFCSVAGVGLDTEVARRANDLPRWLRGHGGYALSVCAEIFRFASVPMKILALDEAGNWTTRSDQPTILAAFANTSTYGGGMKIAPNAKMDDGQLDVCVIGGIDPFKLVCMFPTVYFGRHPSIRGVDYFRAARVRVQTEHALDVYADGECVCRTPIEVSIQRAALKVITR